MFRIDPNGIVVVNRGDSFELPITLNVGDSIEVIPYELKDTDVLYLGIMEPNQPFETAIVRKKLTKADINRHTGLVFRFWPEDTVCLYPGKYYYQIKIKTIDPIYNREDVETVVDKTLFYIQE